MIIKFEWSSWFETSLKPVKKRKTLAFETFEKKNWTEVIEYYLATPPGAKFRGLPGKGGGACGGGMGLMDSGSASLKRLNFASKRSFTVPVGPLRCLPIMISA